MRVAALFLLTLLVSAAYQQTSKSCTERSNEVKAELKAILLKKMDHVFEAKLKAVAKLFGLAKDCPKEFGELLPIFKPILPASVNSVGPIEMLKISSDPTKCDSMRKMVERLEGMNPGGRSLAITETINQLKKKIAAEC